MKMLNIYTYSFNRNQNTFDQNKNVIKTIVYNFFHKKKTIYNFYVLTQ